MFFYLTPIVQDVKFYSINYFFDVGMATKGYQKCDIETKIFREPTNGVRP